MNLAEPQRFAPFEILLLLVLIAASGALFFWRLAPILRNILAARKDLGWSLRPVSKRIWAFTSEVLFQSKVIRERPLPGIAHAFVFWGFLAFALVSLNHIATALSMGFLTPDSWIGPLYFWFAGAWALLVAVSITGLFIRRFFVRPIWLGKKVSVESGFIALLIFTLMVTYLAVFFTSSETTLKALLVDAYARPARLPAADPPHQAPAPRPLADHHLPEARRLLGHPAALD